MFKKLIVVGIAAACVLSTAVNAKHRDKEFTYEVTITNLTNLALLSKTAIATHKKSFKLFELGQPNNILGLEILAETGKAQTLVNEFLENAATVGDVKTAILLKNPTPPPEGPGNEGIRPGETLTATITADYEFSSISVFSMMAPSNDAFVAANSIKVPRHGKTITIFSPVYDSGNEANTEHCYDEDPALGNGGLDTPTVGFDYPAVSFLADDVGGLNNPDYIPVPLPARHNVCRLTDHTVHTADTAPLNTFDFKGTNPTEGKRIPPPRRPASQKGQEGEGVVLIHRGMQGVGQLNPAMFDWRNPGAKITVRRIR